MLTCKKSKSLCCFLGGLLLLALAGRLAAAQTAVDPGPKPPGAVGYDVETHQWLFDSDGDGFPDLTEEIGDTDPFDPHSNPRTEPAAGGEGVGVKLEKVGFQQPACRVGFNSWPGAPRLCITATQNAALYEQAAVSCRTNFSRLCSYEDLSYLYINSNVDAAFDPSGGKWLGDFTANDVVNCGDQSVTFDNDPDIWNFEGACSKFERHPYWCCHDRT